MIAGRRILLAAFGKCGKPDVSSTFMPSSLPRTSRTLPRKVQIPSRVDSKTSGGIRSCVTVEATGFEPRAAPYLLSYPLLRSDRPKHRSPQRY